MASVDYLHHPDDEEDEDEIEDTSSPKKSKRKRDAQPVLRKAPQAPKRFKSSYICFFMAKQQEIKDDLGDEANVTSISKRSAEMWKNLPPEDRAHWDDVALKDKQRYMVEKATYTGPWQVPWKRARKDPSAPKRPMSAFLYFAQGRRTKIKSENPDMKNTEISRILGDIWRNASEEERRPYMEKEREEREKYKVAVAEWKEESDAKREADRKAQIEHSSMMMDPQQQPQMFAEPFGAVGGPFVYATFPYMAPQTGPYHFPTNGKQPVILGRNGMPVYPVHFVPNQSPQQSQTQRQQSPLNQYSRATHGFEDHGHDTGGPYDYADPEGPPAGE